ncbi:unnamed protein product [Paramecium primaurelia]|uniref:Uncharacterized protein n=1 Tax=Paramecium primaurelia TaxID=5886 RepID=A0A8S1LLV6_PARPR|nr:unnamed protein product [Paramecium primaurelia]
MIPKLWNKYGTKIYDQFTRDILQQDQDQRKICRSQMRSNNLKERETIQIDIEVFYLCSFPVEPNYQYFLRTMWSTPLDKTQDRRQQNFFTKEKRLDYFRIPNILFQEIRFLFQNDFFTSRLT